jgi:ribosomal protein S18 acetylase RimI-like enzyme
MAAATNQIRIRRATEDDIPGIAKVLVETWKSTFRGMLPDDFLDGMSYARQEQRHRRTFAIPETTYHVAVDALTEAIVGFANGGPIRHPLFAYQNELYAIYVLDAYQGQRIGTHLLRAAVSDLRRSGRQGLVVWVLASNPNRAFYERHRGRLVSTKPITLGSATVDQVAFAWDDLRSL